MVWMDVCFSSSSSLFVFCYYFFVLVCLILSCMLSPPFLFLMSSSSSCSLSGPCCMYGGGGEVWQRQIAQPQLKGDCLAPCSLKRWIIGIHHEQQHRSHGIDNNRWATTPEKNRGLYLLWKKKDVGWKEKVWKHKTGRGLGGENAEEEQRSGGMERSAEELHLWPQRSAPAAGGGWVGTWMEGIYHYWLVPSSLAQADIPPTVDINHDFSIIDPLSAMEGRNALLVSISAIPRSSVPRFSSAQWCIIIIRHYWNGICGMPGKVCFYTA